MEKVVVTGGAGFIGSHIAEALISRGSEVHVIDTFVEGTRDNVPAGAVLHELDVIDTEAIAPVIEDAFCVFHLAALPRVQFSLDHPQAAHETNVNGTVSVLEAARMGRARRVVFSSSSAIYGDQPVLPLTEQMPAQPKSPYGLHKYVGELYCRLYSEVFNLSTVSLRYFNAYGPRQNPNGAYALVIPKFLEKRKNGEALTITGDGTQTRDFVHTADIVRANMLAMESDTLGKGEVINVGGGKDFSVIRIAELIGGPIEFIAPRLEPRNTLADITLARELLAWEPQVELEQGIAKLKQEAGLT